MSERLIAIEDLGPSGVAQVESSKGTLAVGVSRGEPFATSNRCRHLLAPLGNGKVAEDGCLECPWHHARYDVRTGAMVRGPQGAFKPVAGLVRQTAGQRKISVYDVVERDGVIYLAG
jgi:3-phenylpropionate/trans-cinnamate dioxygenase ferredoxin component